MNVGKSKKLCTVVFKVSSSVDNPVDKNTEKNIQTCLLTQILMIENKQIDR